MTAFLIVLIVLILVAALATAAAKRHNSPYCWPWKHKWTITHVSIGLLDYGRGELWRCDNCPKVRAL
jgi:hypothetical protein